MLFKWIVLVLLLVGTPAYPLLTCPYESLAGQSLQLIGNRERFRIIGEGVELNAKVDTGAKTSSLHATKIERYTDGDREMVRFKTVSDLTLELPVSREVKVKSSNGSSSKRTFVKVPIRLGGKRYVVEFSLANRSKMQFPALLGASFLRGKFLVDVEREYLRSTPQAER